MDTGTAGEIYLQRAEWEPQPQDQQGACPDLPLSLPRATNPNGRPWNVLGRELLFALQPGNREGVDSRPSYLCQSCNCRNRTETAGEGGPRRRSSSLRITPLT